MDMENVTVLTSSKKNELSEELPDWKHGALAEAFLDPFKGAPATEGVIRLSALTDAMDNEVKSLTHDRQHLVVQSRVLVDWIEFKSLWFDCPSFADELVGCESFEGLQSPSEIVRADEVGEMPAELIMAVVVVAFDGRVLDGSVHPFDLTVVQGWLILVKRCSMSFSRQRMANMCDLGSFGPVGRSAAEVRFFHLATVFWLTP